MWGGEGEGHESPEFQNVLNNAATFTYSCEVLQCYVLQHESIRIIFYFYLSRYRVFVTGGEGVCCRFQLCKS